MALNYTGMITRSELITICEKANNNKFINLPITPSEIMFKAQGDMKTLTLLNYGEIPVGTTPKLVEWTVSSFFPYKDNEYWFDINEGEYDPYKDYCKTFYDWYKNQTVLTFQKETWDSYYNCTIKNFEYGQKDGTDNVHYTLDFVEYRSITVKEEDTGYRNKNKNSYAYGQTKYSGQYYYASGEETILDLAKKLYGNTNYYPTLLRLNGWSNLARKFIKGERIIIR